MKHLRDSYCEKHNVCQASNCLHKCGYADFCRGHTCNERNCRSSSMPNYIYCKSHKCIVGNCPFNKIDRQDQLCFHHYKIRK